MPEPLIYELSSPGRPPIPLPEADVPLADLPAGLTRDELPLPELSEADVIRHFTRLSQFNYAVDIGLYPLGSCTMKYNPKVNEEAARLPGFAFSHPLQDPETAQGNLALMYRLQEWLKETGGFGGVSLQPAAGAHGELTGILILRAFHRSRGDDRRTKAPIPPPPA
jgi:glycine dehydrogenase subunit 2